MAIPFSTIFLDDERLEQLQRHLLGQSALVQAQEWADGDNGTAGIIDALTQQVLAETALLAAQQVGKTLERPVAGAEHGLAHAAVIDQGVDGFLKHALLVADDDLGGFEFLQLAEAVVAVDDAAVQIVEVGCGEAAAVELDHGAQVGGDNGQDFEHHGLGRAVALAEVLHHLKALDDLAALLSRRFGKFLAQFLDEMVQIHGAKLFAHAFGADAGLELGIVSRAQVLFALDDDVGFGERRFALVDDQVTGILDDDALKLRGETVRIFFLEQGVFRLGENLSLAVGQMSHRGDDVAVLRARLAAFGFDGVAVFAQSCEI